MRPQCIFDGCVEPHHGRGLCSSHYRQYRHGFAVTPIKHRPNVKDWIAAHVSHSGDDCLIWPFYRSPNGYASAKDGWAYRIMCEMANGPPPTAKHEAAHSCGKGHEGCVNPKHLRWATSKENKADMLAHGTRPRGEKQGSAKLTAEQVRQIRSLPLNANKGAFAKQFGISRAYIYEVYNGNSWRHI